MRSSFLYLLVVLCISVSFLEGCKKDSPATLPALIPLPVPNTAPRVDAGQDIWIVVPDNSCTLKGSALDEEKNIEKFVWQKISGPLSGIIESPHTLETKVSTLEKGSYQFELDVADKGGLHTKDTVSVFVQEPASSTQGEVIFKYLTWNCPMGCNLQIDCFPCYVPANTPFKVYLAEGNSNQWFEVIPVDKSADHDKYVYGFYNNNLWIYTNDDPNTTSNVRIRF